MQMKSRLSAISVGILAASMLLTTASFAAANYKGEGNYKGETMAPVAPCNVLTLKDGFYVGLQGGYDSYRVRQSTSATGLVATNVRNPVLSANGFAGGLFAGYGKYFDTFYLGGEIFASGTGASSDYTTSTTIAGLTSSHYSKVSVGATYGIAVLPGLKLNDSSLGYIRLGYNRANLKAKDSTATTGLAGGYSSKSSTQGGFNYGVGIETAIAQNVSLRGEFDHADYSSIRTNSSNKYTFSNNEFMLGLGYHFA